MTHLAMALMMAMSLCAWAPSAKADLTSQVRTIINAADLRETQVSVLMVDLTTHTTLASINPDMPMIPASNMKLLTTAAALETLGPDFAFRTELRMIPPAPRTPGPGSPGSPGRDVNGGASGAISGGGGVSLVIKGDGDPAFGDADILARHGLDIEKLIDAWVEAVKATNVKHFKSIVIDDRVFDQDFVHSTWPVDQLNQWYCAQVAGINFNDNCVDIYPEPTVAGQSPRVLVWPLVPAISMTNRAITGSADTFWVSRKVGSNDMVFYGKVKHRRSRPVNVTIHDPPMFFGQLMQHRLHQAGVVVDEVVRPASDAILPRGQVLHVVRTTIDQVLQRCNKDSQNLFAEALFKRMGRKVTGQPGSWENGAAAMRIFLHGKLGARSVALSVADGSGMSRDNRVTARSLIEIMTAMMRNPATAEPYLHSLSIGGKDGTLRRRFDGLPSGVTILGKSGYIRSVCTLTGLVVVADESAPGRQRTVAFSLLFNGFEPPVYLHKVRQTQDKLVEMIYQNLQEKAQAAAR